MKRHLPYFAGNLTAIYDTQCNFHTFEVSSRHQVVCSSKLGKDTQKPCAVTHKLVLTPTRFGWAGHVMRMEESDPAVKVVCTVLNQEKMEVEEEEGQN